jgi:ADP-ribose pyrophosphatase
MTALRVLDSRRVYDGISWSLRLDTIQSGDGPPVQQEVVEYPESTVIVPITDRGTIVMVRQFRHAAGESLLELPAGKSESVDASPEASAQRELREETGYRAGRLISMGAQWAAPGYSTEWMHRFLALDLSPDPLPEDIDEDILVQEHSLSSISEMIRSGEIRDMMSVATLMMAINLYADYLPDVTPRDA